MNPNTITRLSALLPDWKIRANAETPRQWVFLTAPGGKEGDNLALVQSLFSRVEVSIIGENYFAFPGSEAALEDNAEGACDLQRWINCSPNAAPGNRLLSCLGLKGGKILYTSYRWENRAIDPDEESVYIAKNEKRITREEAEALL